MAKEIDFFDSNILIAASVPEHPYHSESYAVLARLQHGGGACSSHTLAETYNTLTKSSKGYGIPPHRVLPILQHARETYQMIALTPEESFHAIEDIARHRLPGAIVYDALILACARKARATRIYTLNRKHLLQIAPNLADRILEP